MVRTAGTAIKTGGGKSSKGVQGVSSGRSNTSSISSGSKRGVIGGNKLIHRPTPNWQQPITSFFRGNATENCILSEEVAEVKPVDIDDKVFLTPPEWQIPITSFLDKNDVEKTVDISKALETGGPKDDKTGAGKELVEDVVENPPKRKKICYKDLEEMEKN